MINVSFDNNTDPVAPPAAETAVAVREETAVAVTGRQTSRGEITRDDIQTPYLSIIQKTSELSGDFKPGSLVLSKTHNLGAGPLSVIAVDYRKRYKEVVDFDNPHTENPRWFNTAAEVTAAGLVVGKATSKAFEEEAAPQADILLWIEKPADAAPEAADAFDVVLPSGRVGALALFTAARTSYNTSAKPLITAEERNKIVREREEKGLNGLPAVQWKLSITHEQYKKTAWFQAHLVPAGRVDEQDVEFLADFGS